MALQPVQTSYPGVYVAEVPSGVRTITGVATSITAFVGRALRGPTDEPVTLYSWGDFERVFGGLWVKSHLGYSVKDFFDLGGGTAVVVRVHKKSAAAADDRATISVGTGANAVKLVAASPGGWGAKLTAIFDKQTANTGDPKLFNLIVKDTSNDYTETFRNVSLAADSDRRVDLVLASSSTLVRLDGSPAGALPAVPAAAATAAGGDDGLPITQDEISTATGMDVAKTGMYALEKTDLVNMIVIPPYKGTSTEVGDWDVDADVITNAHKYAIQRRAVVILDPAPGWTTPALAKAGAGASPYVRGDHAAVYFPRIKKSDPKHDGQVMTFAPSGAVAGLIAATDANRGVWKSPAGLDTVLRGVTAPSVQLTDAEIGALNPVGVNCLRTAPGIGTVVWGARTRDGNDALASDWKYLAVRRTALFLEESLFRGMQWAVFEPNDEPLWAQIRLNIGAFMNDLFRKGAFQGVTPKDAYFVKCDKETTTQTDINLGVVNINVGFAPLKPAEFVILRLQQMAGQITV